MFSTLIALSILAFSHSLTTSYEPFPPTNPIPNIDKSIEASIQRKALLSNQLLSCGFFETMGIVHLQDLIETFASRKGLSALYVLKMLQRRFKSMEDMEEKISNEVIEHSHPNFRNLPMMEPHPKIRFQPVPHPAAYSIQSPENLPMKSAKEDIIFVPIDSSVSPMRERPMGMHPHPLMSVIKSKTSQLKAPFSATIRVDGGDPNSPLNRDISITVSPLMTVLEALRQAETSYESTLGVKQDLFRFAPSLSQDCFVVYSVNDVSNTENSAWKITVRDRDSQIIHDSPCIPKDEDLLIKPRTLISLTYVPL